MKQYAMILSGIVIDIVKADTKPNYPPDPFGNLVIAVETKEDIKIGMGYSDGVFTESPPDLEDTDLNFDTNPTEAKLDYLIMMQGGEDL